MLNHRLTRRSFVKATAALSAVLMISQKVNLLSRPNTAIADSSEVSLICAHDTGPFYAHVKDGRWIRSTPVEPNALVGHNAYSVRNRLYAANRIRYPMKRADFDVNNRNAQNRGKSQFVRISWDEALNLVSSELSRVKATYGPSAICQSVVGHQWFGNMNSTGGMWGIPFSGASWGWASRFFALLGGCTAIGGNNSYTGWDAGGPIVFGYSSGPLWSGTGINTSADILAHSKLIIFWGTDPAMKSYVTLQQNVYLRKYKDAGIMTVVIDPYQTDTASVYADKWIPIEPETDEALMAAIAYVWISQGLVDEAFVNSHAVGYQQFKSYILGEDDGIPKTPKWAEPITGIEAEMIRALALRWMSGPTYVDCFYSGCNRREHPANFVRWIVTLQTISGNLGRPGGGIGGGAGRPGGPEPYPPPNMPLFGYPPGLSNPIAQTIRHGSFAEAVLTGKSSFTTVDTSTGAISKVDYPMPGLSEIHLVAFLSGSGYFLNQIGNVNEHIGALQSSKIEFVYSHAAWWEATPKMSDVVLPVRHVGEREDITNWENYLVFMNKVVDPGPEVWNDYDIFVALANRLGFGADFTQGKSYDDWLRSMYDAAGLSDTFDSFKAKGYIKYDFGDWPATVGLQGFHDDPAHNALNTPSGKVEIFSQRVADFFGSNNEQAQAIPKYLPSLEDTDATLSAKYPLVMKTSHPKFGRHSQWQNMSWQRDESQAAGGDYLEVRMNPADAAARGLKTGDVAKIFNDRGSILRGVTVTDRMRPGAILVYEGGWYTPQQPGVVGSLDIGGNCNVLTPGRQPEPLCDGLMSNARVEVVKWEGS
jgi:molybdopterin guanine dinucleotide-containing S/N-oxide reductase-like protein